MSRPPRRPPPPRHTVAVEIAGEKHVLRSDVPPEYTRRVASHVDATIRALPGFQTLEPFRAATLAALSITDELFHARDEIRRLREEAERRTAELADELEAAEGAGAEKRPVRRPAAAPPSPAAETPPPLPDAPHPAWASAPVEEKRDAGPSLFSGEEPELNLPPPDE
ncbi:MAG TPA: cell division protein ZapA [Longimicrobium sp.]|nr:cell division protein ZapA [Longimicrobium sp.]